MPTTPVHGVERLLVHGDRDVAAAGGGVTRRRRPQAVLVAQVEGERGQGSALGGDRRDAGVGGDADAHLRRRQPEDVRRAEQEPAPVGLRVERSPISNWARWANHPQIGEVSVSWRSGRT